MTSMAPATAKSQALNNFTLPFDLKWSTSSAKNNGDKNSSNSNNNNDGYASSGKVSGNGGGRSKHRSRNLRDSSGRRPVQQSDSSSFSSKEGVETEKRSRNHHQVFERGLNLATNGSYASSDRMIDQLEKRISVDRLIEKSEKRAMKVSSYRGVNLEEKTVVVYSHSISKEKRVAVADRLIDLSEKGNGPDRSFEKSEKKANGSDRLVEGLDKKATGAIRLKERSEKKEVGFDRLMEKSEKKATSSDRPVEKLEKKARLSDLLIVNSEKTAMAKVHDRSVDKSEKKTAFPESLAEKTEERPEGSDVKSKLLIRFKGKGKHEDGAAEKVTEAVGGGEELEVKTWNLRPRKPPSKKMDANGGSSMSTGGGALVQECKMPQSPQKAGGTSKTKNDTTRVRTHADAKIAQLKDKKMIIRIPLLKDEIEEDIFVMTGSKPARRPKKRPRNVQKQLDSVFPGLWLSTISPDSYKVSETIPKG